jgi:putative ABC transport system permease protein
MFFLVAALISLTTMTRMVEEERTQIGTLKALGYSKMAIASKYMKYALFATLGGSVFGVLIGEKIFPWVIISAYGMMYPYLPKMILSYHWDYALLAMGAALICTLGATFSACIHELQAVPAQLMRPPAPKEGKRVLLERIPFLWKRLNFTWKSTVRNLVRYKKRFLMTVIGIGGCMGLLLIGYGLQDSIMSIGTLQFDELQTYDAMVILDTDASEEKQQTVQDLIASDERITDSMRFFVQQETVDTEGLANKEWSVYVYVPEEPDALQAFVSLRGRVSREAYELTDEGAIITEKIANELGLQVGDCIPLRQDNGDDIQVPILAICENYLSHYLYMTPALYEKLYGEAPDFNSVFWCTDESQETAEEIGENLLNQDAVLNITYTASLKDQIDSMLGAMDIVMIVIIVSAGMLAFVVLYNLNNININERRRELATLKVLGFFSTEVAAYVYRENILLTVIGAALGVFLGKFLHMYVITTVEVDACMFGRNINFSSFVYGVLFTFGFSIIVNFAMYFKLKKIDMVESLKSIE